MPRQLHLEGPALEPVLARAREEHGPDVTVVAAHRVRRGGVAGFFAREHFEVVISVPSPEAARAGAPAPAVRPAPAVPPAGSPATEAATAAVPVPVRRRPGAIAAGPATLEQLLSAADGADTAAVGAPAAPTASTLFESSPASSPAVPMFSAPAAPAREVPAPWVHRTAVDSTTGTEATGQTQVTPELATASVGAGPTDAPTGPRRPGRQLSTEAPGFDEVLATLRADLLGPTADAAPALPLTAFGPGPFPAASAKPWSPTVLDEPADAPAEAAAEPGPQDRAEPTPAARAASDEIPTSAADPAADVAEEMNAEMNAVLDHDPTGHLDADLDGDLDADPSLHLDADLAAYLAGSPDTDGDAGPTRGAGQASTTGATAATRDVPVDAEPQLTELLTLARLVGAGPARAGAAALDVMSSGVSDLRRALPLLAAALADDLAAQTAATPGRASLDSSRPDVLGARAGELVVVVGSPDRVVGAARDVAAHLGTHLLAHWSDEPSGRCRDELHLDDVRRVPALLGRAREAGLPLVVQLPDPTLEDGVAPGQAGTGRSAVLRAVAPDLVVLAVDAGASPRRQQSVTSRVQVAYGVERSLLVALVGCSYAAAPLAHADRPVALLDGRPATRGVWTGVLLDALRDVAGS